MRRVRRAAALLALWPATAQAHLVNTGLGPFYDGVSHFGLTPEDLLPAVAIRVPWGRIAVRVAGSWIAAVGLLLLGWSLRPT